MEKVSVIIPCYNAQEYIAQAIKSVLMQTYKNIEIIIVNDGSVDKSEKIIKSFQDRRIKYIKQKNSGVAITRNTGIKNATGKYIAFLDADDLYEKDKIEQELFFLKKHPGFDLVYCDMAHFYDGCPKKLFSHQGPRPQGEVFQDLLHQFFCQLNTVLIPKTIFDQVGAFDEKSRHSEEWDLYLRIARAGFRFGFLNKRLVKIRISKNSLSRFDNQWQMKKNNLAVFERLFSSMDEEERQRHSSDKIISKLKLKLAAAYLLVGKKKQSLEVLKSITLKNPLMKFLNTFFVIIIYLIPVWCLKKFFNWVWKIKHKKLFVPLN